MNKINMLQFENYLSEYASFDKDAIRIKKLTDNDFRPNYFRDTDRIIHSLSYTRYIDKTQVFSNKDNDNISKRIIHVQLVSKIARTIGRALKLNEDLIEAIALGHDIGHTPYGHLGEAILNELSNQYNEGNFMHNVQSVRTLMFLESKGYGKNLCIQTLDGILCHNGEFVSKNYQPKKKTIEDFFKDYESCYHDINYTKELIPMTIEGCVVRISDVIAYLGRDIEDAIRLGVFDKSLIPENIKDVLGDNNHDIISNIIIDIIENSYNKNYISMSDKVFNAIKELKDFNYKYIYNKANSDDDKNRIKLMFKTIMSSTLDDLKKNKLDSNVYKVYLNNMNDEYWNNNTDTRIVIDYIAGMTDEYFNNEYEKILRK